MAAVTPRPTRVEAELETLLDSVSLAEAMCVRLAESAGFDEDDCFRIGMVVHEGVINAYRHGNHGQLGKKIHLVCEMQHDKLVLRIADQGCGFDLASIPDPTAQENLLKPCGRGIFLMRSLMDEFDVRRSREGGAELVMAKRFPRANGANASNGASGSNGRRTL